jgi:hypothetical protein
MQKVTNQLRTQNSPTPHPISSPSFFAFFTRAPSLKLWLCSRSVAEAMAQDTEAYGEGDALDTAAPQTGAKASTLSQLFPDHGSLLIELTQQRSLTTSCRGHITEITEPL